MKIQPISNNHLPITNHHDASGTISTTVERTLQIAPFLTNKANFQKSQINVNPFITTNYEQRTMNYERKNKPNSNPIQTQNKANTKPIQSQFKPKQTQFHMILACFSSNPLILAYLLSRQKNAAFRLYAVGYLRKKWYSVILLTENLRLISRLMAKEKLK